MRTLTWSVVFLLLWGAVAVASSFGRVKSSELRSVLESHPDLFQGFENDPGKRANIAREAWLMATLTESVEDRPYNFSFAIDIYRTLPAEERPLGGYNPGEAKGKVLVEDTMLQELVSSEKTLSAAWKRLLKRPDNSHLKERRYLLHFVRSYVQIEDAETPATLRISDIDFSNPTHYQPMKQWMARHTTAMTEGIPPWEAEAWTKANVPDDGYKPPAKVERPAPVTAPTNQDSQQAEQQGKQEAAQQQVAPTPTQEQPQERLAEQANSRWPLFAVIGLVVAALVAFFVLRKRRK